VAQLTFFYDLSSPWTYLAFNNVQEVIAETQATVSWRPFLVGGVFNAVNQSVYAARSNPRDPKVIHNFTWLHEWARLANLPLDFPTEHHPVKSVLPMRMCCALEHDQEVLKAFTQAAFDAYFADGRNIDDHLVMADVAKSIGRDGEAVLVRRSSLQLKIGYEPTQRRPLQRARTARPPCWSTMHSFILVTINCRWCVRRLLSKGRQSRTACTVGLAAWGRCVFREAGTSVPFC